MNRRRWVGSLIFTACVAFAIGWRVESGRAKRVASEHSKLSIGDKQSTQIPGCHAEVPGSHWQTVRTFFYSPRKKTYIVDWETCSADVHGGRVRVTDADPQRILYKIEDDEIVRVEMVELLDEPVPQLLIATGSGATNDRVDWHVLSEVNGQLQEWKWPDYDALSKKLLKVDEDFCCKEWNLHLRGKNVVLARGIYHKDEDGNCCPSRGGVLVWLQPVQVGFKVVRVQRISGAEYDRASREAFCLECTLVGP